MARRRAVDKVKDREWQITYRGGAYTHFTFDMDATPEQVIAAHKAQFSIPGRPREYDGATAALVPLNGGHPFAADAMIDKCLEARPDLTREDWEGADYFMFLNDRTKTRRGAYVVSIPEAIKILQDKDSDYDDFVYFRRFGVVVFNVTADVSHEIFLCVWHYILSNVLSGKREHPDAVTWRNDRDPEKFLHELHGCYLSSAYGTCNILASEDFTLTFQEKKMFEGFKVRRIAEDYPHGVR